MGRPKKYTQERATTAIRMPKELHQRLQEAAAERDISANLLAVKAIASYLDQLVPPEELLVTRDELHAAS
jgi:predicted HicB family RNase H-like nuclease